VIIEAEKHSFGCADHIVSRIGMHKASVNDGNRGVIETAVAVNNKGRAVVILRFKRESCVVGLSGYDLFQLIDWPG
jgi:hypothetical protein